MSFLNQLRSQAKALQSERVAQDERLGESTLRTEQACQRVLAYLQDLAQQLGVIQPPGPALSLDGRTPWPAMKLADFRVDARRKRVADRELFDYIAMGWLIVPAAGGPVGGLVRVNFPTDMRRVEDRLAMGAVKHERFEVRAPERQDVLQEVRYEYQAQARASVAATADHARGMLHFRLVNTKGFEVVQTDWPVARIDEALLDELARRVVGEPSTFA